MNELNERVKFAEGVLTLLGDNGDEAKVPLSENSVGNLKWLSTSDIGSVFTQEGSEWELFFGPYIMSNETGYVFQSLNRYTRKTVEVRVPFTHKVDMRKVRAFIGELVS